MTLKMSRAFMVGAMIGLLATVTFLAIWVYQLKPQTAFGGAPPGFQASIASSSQITIGGNAVLQIFATSTCVSRIVTPHSPQGSWLRILFADSAQEPSPGEGHLLTASSTTNFDSVVFGCGRWRVFNNSASTTIFTVTEFSDFK
mgnify:FL=1